MRILLIILFPWLALLHLPALAQRPIYDKHIVHQQERMVFKEWDRDKFTPKKGFLGLNPAYWLTWAWHPDYPDKDRRPLGPSGMQTQRIGLVLAMQQATHFYKLHTDTLARVARAEMVRYAPLTSDADPLWQLYYRQELQGLLEEEGASGEENENIREYLTGKGIYQWYHEERLGLKERLEAARSATMGRGSRILTYHRLLKEYRDLRAIWESAKRNAAQYLAFTRHRDRVQQRAATGTDFTPGRTDMEIADDILAGSKL